MKLDLAHLEWKKVIFILLAASSIVPLHVASFIYAIPSAFRPIIGSEVKIALGLEIATKSIFFAFLARYVPQLFYGLVSVFYKNIVQAKYYQRGYRRIYVSFSGFGRRSQSFKSFDEIKTHLRRCAVFDRGNARLSNLITKKLSGTLGFYFFTQHKTLITAALGVALFVLTYLGVFRAVLVLLILVVFWAALVFYGSSRSLYIFNLSRNFWDSYAAEQEAEVDLDDILTILSTLACCAVLSGFLRVGYLASSSDAIMNNQEAPVSIIVSNAQGVLVFLKDGKYQFVGWPTVISND